MNKKPILILGIVMIVVGAIFAIVMSVLSGQNVKISSGSWYDGPATIAVGIIIIAIGVVATIYSTAKIKVDAGAVDVETIDAPPQSEPQDPKSGGAS